MSNRGWAFFLVGVLLSSFLGGALRVFFSPQRVRAWVDEVSARRQPKFTLEFKDAHITLANGWFPGLAVEFIDLKIQSRDPCVTGTQVLVNKLNVSVPLENLFGKKVRFGRIFADQINFRYQPANCTTEIKIPKLVADKKPLPVVTNIEKFMQQRWSKEIQNTFQILTSVHVDQLLYYHLGSVDPHFVLSDLDLDQPEEKAGLSLSFLFTPGFIWTADIPVGKLRSHIQFDSEKISYSGRGNLKEGQYNLDIDWRLAEGQIKVDSQLRDMPAAPLLKLMDRWQLIRWNNSKVSNQWFRCHISGSGQSIDWDKMPMRIEACSFYGDMGDAILRDTDSQLLQGKIYPIVLSLSRVKTASLTNLDTFSNLNPGSNAALTGELYWDNFDQHHFVGFLEKPNLSVKGFPWASLVGDRVGLSWKKEDWKFQIDFQDWVFAEQTYDLKFSMLKDGLKNNSRLNFSSKLQGRPDFIQKLDVASDWKDLQLNAELSWIDDKLSAFQVKAEAPYFSISKVNFNSFSGQFSFQNEKGKLEVHAKKASDFSKSSLRILGRFFEISNWELDAYSNLEFKLEFENTGRWVVNPLAFTNPMNLNQNANFIGRGYERSVDEGFFTLYENKKRLQRMQVLGTFLEPRIVVAEP